MLEDLLSTQVRTLREQAAHHDTDDFMDRLAARVAAEAKRPGRIRYLSGTPVPVPGLELPGLPTEPEPIATQVSPPPPGPDPALSRPGGPSRPLTRRGFRRRPSPIIPPDPGASQYAVATYVKQLCNAVLRSKEIETLADFAATYDQAGARTFACLQYTLNRREKALYWWRFAAGAGDALAAHLLAAHHAAVGQSPDARVWRVHARMLGYSDNDLPEPAGPRDERTDSEFIDAQLLQELAAR
ncbi:hypothetical protein OG730_43775 (plasmid) [Streptomyces sp. NBC_01298]|uniref:hypothetical protein n=1 Tax=Streptomyces sp. NBC_01298 TaxID=2903817 RepID=UPI002E147388|nr:hypothetical protein OG730_43775 [Streptomyces sp. NBC_01298]